MGLTYILQQTLWKLFVNIFVNYVFICSTLFCISDPCFEDADRQFGMSVSQIETMASKNAAAAKDRYNQANGAVALTNNGYLDLGTLEGFVVICYKI